MPDASSNRVCECRNPDWQPCSDCPRHDAIPNSAADLGSGECGDCECWDDATCYRGRATRNRVGTEAEFLEHVRMELCTILSAVNGIRTEDARTLIIELRDEVEARLG